MNLLSKKGFSLVEALVAVSIVGIGSIAVGQLVSHLLSAQAMQKNFEQAQETAGIVSALLTDSDYCTLNFGGLVIPGGQLPKKFANPVNFKTITETGKLGKDSIVGPGYKRGNLEVSAIELWTTQIIKAPTKYTGEVRMKFKSENGGIPLQREIPLFMEVFGGKITSCSRVLVNGDNLANGSYSENCDDFASKGWGSKQACLQDGRVHHVFSNNAAGVATYGTLAALKQHADKGAEVKVRFTPLGTINMSYANCIDFGLFDGFGLCRTGTVDGIPDWNGGGDPKTISAYSSSQFYFTNGLFVFSKSPPKNDLSIKSSPASAKVAMLWFIKY